MLTTLCTRFDEFGYIYKRETKLAKIKKDTSLRKAILQAAITGQLISNVDGETETGKQLLDRIIEERNIKLLAEWEEKLKENPKTKKPTQIVASEIDDDEIPFEIPESWCWCRWGELSDSIQYGYNAPAKESGRIKMVRITDIQDGKVQWETVPYCEISEEEILSYKLKKNDILFARTGGTVGKSFLVDEEPENSVYAGYLIRTQYDSKKLNPKYLKMFMESQLYWEQLKNGTIATAQPNCNGQTLSKMIVPLPPLAVQNAIVAKLEEVLPFVDAYENAVLQKEELKNALPDKVKKAILQEAIQGKLTESWRKTATIEETGKQLLDRIIEERNAKLLAEWEEKLKDNPKAKKPTLIVASEIDGEDVPFEVPDSWCWCRFGDIFSTMSGLGYKKDVLVEKSEKMIRVLRGGNILDTSYIFKPDDIMISDKYVKPELFLKKNYLITPAVTSLEHIGKIGYVEKDYTDTVVGGFVLMLIPHYHNEILSKYFLYLFGTRWLRDMCKEITHKSGQAFYNLSRDKLLQLQIPLPPLAEQEKIVEIIEQMLPLCEKLGG